MADLQRRRERAEASAHVQTPGQITGIALGTNVVIAYAVGHGNREDVQKAVHTSVLVAVIGGVRIMWVRLVFPRNSTFQTIMMAYPISLITTTLLIFIALLYYRPAKRFARMEEPL